MRITFVLPTVSLSGGIRVIANHAKALTARRHKVALVSPPPRTLPYRRKFKSLLSGNGWPSESPPLFSHIDRSKIDHRVLSQWRPVEDDDVPDGDIVIATWWETAEWVNALSDRKGAKVYFIQGYEIFPHQPVDRVRNTYRLPFHKIVIAKWLGEVMHREYSDPIVDLVPNSIDRRLFHADVRRKQRRPTVGFLHSNVPEKGTDITLKVINALRQKLPYLRVIAFGAYKPAADYPLDPSIEFHLAPPQDKIPTLYAQCDVWITSSRSEGFNLPPMEAMACRTPVVSTKTGWPAEVIESLKNGILVDVDDVEGLIRGAEWILSLSDGEWRNMSQRAYETTLSGSWEDSSRRFEDALVHACRRSMSGEIAGKCVCA
jgi:glycosyltransferase involved in cell wall biosynthesis